MSRIDEDITFRKLEALLAFMEARNLARAAELLGVSPVSVHRALHSLEAAMRCTLFRHQGRNLSPTDAAHVLAQVARDVLRAMDEGIRETRQAAGYSSSRLRIGSLYSLTIATVPRVVIALKLRRPNWRPSCCSAPNADLLARLRQGVVDAALIAVPASDDPELISITLFEDDICFAAPVGSKYAGREAIDLRECAGERFVTLTEGFATYDGFIDAFSIAGFDPEVVMKVGDIYSLMNLVGGGVGCTLLPGRVRDVYANKVELIALEPRYSMRQTIGLSFLRSRERDPNLLALAAVCRTSGEPLKPPRLAARRLRRP